MAFRLSPDRVEVSLLYEDEDRRVPIVLCFGFIRRVRLLDSSCPFARPYSARISVKFDIGDSYENLSRNWKLV